MFNKTKTTASVFAAFTKDLEAIATQQLKVSESAEKREAIAKQQKMDAINEATKAKRAVNSIMKMLEG